MKQLKRLLLFLSCVFLLPLLQEESPFIASGSQTIIHAYTANVISHADNNQADVTAISGEQCFKSSIRKYNHRTRALNDYHELCLFVPSIRIKTCFVYIPAVYSGYKNSYISVAVTLSDWRGPPVV
ncbi:hypothetical protein [Chitinophaga filiformis]|uniref:hypothetical protein n=1 Tax=Chitinophaga filiformis TaxID=104663 RepID=UPI00115FB3B4|nr:hypothetical protein [Chitinophaga filiformis]